MAKNFFQPGDELDIVAGESGLVGGQMATAGSLVGVVAASVGPNVVGVMSIKGVFKLTKAGAETWTQGAPVYRVGSTQTVSTTAAGGTFMGYAAYASPGADAFGYVLLARPGS